jgi:hypothetical protein
LGIGLTPNSTAPTLLGIGLTPNGTAPALLGIGLTPNSTGLILFRVGLTPMKTALVVIYKAVLPLKTVKIALKLDFKQSNYQNIKQSNTPALIIKDLNRCKEIWLFNKYHLRNLSFQCLSRYDVK